ncbi:helix-turn-helix transcriptional regulator [Qiania dongpingensis]|uniref:YafY family transcriptional regulator n=1 Tax=Qiania dongpingensis TaxID=2763669 RepID=A0A7G9G3M3_9FIRM|nr:YafY family protein [Qiania dongpingensis]QNM05405.1 YafY family transcriptional regulator [Qiania dongpingensis]
MQINRLFEIVYIMLDRRHITAKELARQFGVSIRTIYRDIDILSSAGIPLYTVQGTGGGIYMDEHFKFRNSLLTDEERNQILIALQSIMTTEELETSRLLSKLSGLFQIRHTDWIEIDFSRWGSRRRDKEYFRLLKNAVFGCRAVKLNYISSYGSITDRYVFPVKLVYKSRAWYIQAYDKDREAYRTFRISRILDLETTSDSFERKGLPEPPEIEQSDSSPGTLVHVKLRCSPHLGYRLYDEFDPAAISQDKDGSFLAAASLPEDPWLYGYLLSFGSGLEVLEPLSVKEMLLKEAGKIQSSYDKKVKK